LLARVAWLKTDDPAYREVIGMSKLYTRGAYPGFPFPKTRRIVFLEDRPAALPGWVLLEVAA
jgi:CRISPR-associated protein Csm5